MRAAVLLSARNKATRLPGKAFLDLGGQPLTLRLIDRLRRAREPEKILLATSGHPDDNPLVALAEGAGIGVFRGSEEDKLDRYLGAARAHGLDLVVIVDGDDPFCDPGYVDRVVRRARDSGADLVRCAGLPVGIASTAIRTEALARVCEIKAERDTEVWAGYFTETGLFRVETVEADPAHAAPEIRLTLDYPEDLEVIRAIDAACGGPHRPYGIDEILGFLRRSPEVSARNQAAAALYEENLRRITRVKIRSGATGPDGKPVG